MTAPVIHDARLQAFTDRQWCVPVEYLRSVGAYWAPLSKCLALVPGAFVPKGADGGVVIPYHLPDAKQPHTHRVRWDSSWEMALDPKYGQASGSGPLVYIPPGVTASDVADPAAPRLLLEGEAKVWALDAAGLLPGVMKLATAGCWTVAGWLLDHAKGCEWTICFDGDRMGNPRIIAAERSLAARLLCAGARSVKRVKAWNPEQWGTGIDDVMKVHGVEKARELLSQVEDVLVVHKNPAQAARTFLDAEFTDRDRRLLRYWQGGFYVWNGKAWGELATDNSNHIGLRVRFVEWVRSIDPLHHPTAAWVKQAVDALMQDPDVFLPTAECDGWIGKEEAPEHVGRLVPVQNGLLDPVTEEVYPHNPDVWTLAPRSFAWEPTAKAPRWEKAVEEWFPGKEAEGHRALLQEIVGCVAFSRRAVDKMFMFLGPPRAGKGTTLEIMRHLVGIENCAALDIGQSKGTVFSMEHLKIHTRLLSYSDERDTGDNYVPITPFLLKVTSGEPVTIPRKHRPSLEGIVQGYPVLVSNTVLRLPDASAVIATRIVGLRFVRSYLGKEAHALKEELRGELPGIAGWALAGWKRLVKHGMKFTATTDDEALRRDNEGAASPEARFAREYLDFTNPASAVPVELVYRVWGRFVSEEMEQARRNKTQVCNGVEAFAATLGHRVHKGQIRNLDKLTQVGRGAVSYKVPVRARRRDGLVYHYKDRPDVLHGVSIRRGVCDDLWSPGPPTLVRMSG